MRVEKVNLHCGAQIVVSVREDEACMPKSVIPLKCVLCGIKYRLRLIWFRVFNAPKYRALNQELLAGFEERKYDNATMRNLSALGSGGMSK